MTPQRVAKSQPQTMPLLSTGKVSSNFCCVIVEAVENEDFIPFRLKHLIDHSHLTPSAVGDSAKGLAVAKRQSLSQPKTVTLFPTGKFSSEFGLLFRSFPRTFGA